MTPEKLNDLRRRVLNSEPIDEAEYAAAVREMVSARVTAIQAPTPAKKTKAPTKAISLDDLLPG